MTYPTPVNVGDQALASQYNALLTNPIGIYRSNYQYRVSGKVTEAVKTTSAASGITSTTNSDWRVLESTQQDDQVMPKGTITGGSVDMWAVTSTIGGTFTALNTTASIYYSLQLLAFAHGSTETFNIRFALYNCTTGVGGVVQLGSGPDSFSANAISPSSQPTPINITGLTVGNVYIVFLQGWWSALHNSNAGYIDRVYIGVTMD